MMEYFDVIISDLIKVILRLSEITDISANVLIFILPLLLLLFFLVFIILLKLRSVGRAVINVDQRLDTLVTQLDQGSAGFNLSTADQDEWTSDQEQEKFIDSEKQENITQEAETTILAEEDLIRIVSNATSDNPTRENTETTTAIENEEVESSLTSDSSLKIMVLDLISNDDRGIGLQDIVKNLSVEYFDGNYNPILNTLDELEREEKIEGQSISGKLFFRKKQE